jgi:hypothetical protein
LLGGIDGSDVCPCDPPITDNSDVIFFHVVGR